MPADAFPDWELLVQTFGVTEFYTSVHGNYDQDGFALWELLAARHARSQGSCFGFATSSLLDFADHNLFSIVKFPSLMPYSTLNGIIFDDNARKAINSMQLYNYSYDHYSALLTLNASTTPRQALEQLKTFLLDDDPTRASLLILQAVIDTPHGPSYAGHALVPWRLRRDLEAGIFWVDVYNPNFPNEVESVEIDSVGNQWEYNEKGRLWPRSPQSSGLYLADPISSYFQAPIIRPPGSQLRTPMLRDASQDIEIYVDRGSALTLSRDGNVLVRYEDGVLDDTGGGRAIPSLSGGPEEPVGYVVPPGAFDIRVGSSTDERISVGVRESGRFYVVEREDAGLFDEDVLYYNDGLGITNRNGTQERVTLRAIASESGTTQSCRLSGLSLGVGDSVSVRLTETDIVRLENQAGAIMCNLALHYADAGTTGMFFHSSIALEDGARYDIAPEWANLSSIPVKVRVDLGSNGSIDDSLALTNQVDVPPPSAFQSTHLSVEIFGNPGVLGTTIRFNLATPETPRIEVFAVDGHRVLTLPEEEERAGLHEVRIPPGTLSPGIYFVRVIAGKEIATARIVILN